MLKWERSDRRKVPLLMMNLLQNLLAAVLLFFIQPTFIVGLLLAIFSRNQRVSYARSQLRAAIYKENYELKRFLLWGLIPGLLVSGVSILAGLPVTLEWIALYQVVTLVFLGLGYRFVHPIFTFTASGVGLLIAYHFDWTLSSILGPTMEGYSLAENNWETALQLNQIILIMALLLLLSTIITLQLGDLTKFTPRFLQTKRGKLVARYRMKPFWLVPLLVIIPGESFGALFEWWPVFSIGNQTFSFFLLPVLLGFRYTVQAQLPSQAKDRLLKEFVWLAGLGIALFAATFWEAIVAPIALGVLFIGGFSVLYRHRKREQRWSFQFGPAEQGLRVVGIRPNSPVEKMGLDIGDTILDCNDYELHDAEEFYEALSSNRAYCKLRIRRKDGELVLTETAIYDDDPHDLGVITLEEIEIK
jgi:hypothetical protein